MYCSHCGTVLDNQSNFCYKCGMAQEIFSQRENILPLYHLPVTDKRKCDIEVWQDRVVFSGKFFYLKNKELYKNKGQTETAYLDNYLGMGYLSQRSYCKTLFFLVGGTILELAKFILDKLSDFVDKVNNYLKWIDWSISLPAWMNNTVNVIAILCLLFAVILFFSKKKVIEITFTDQRICVPQKSISQEEYKMLYQAIKSARNIK